MKQYHSPIVDLFMLTGEDVLTSSGSLRAVAAAEDCEYRAWSSVYQSN